MGYINRICSRGNKVDVTVGAGGDDGYWDDASTFDNSLPSAFLGRSGSNILCMFARFTGITIPAGVSLQSATVYMYKNDGVGTPSGCLLYFNDTATPVAPTTRALAAGKVKTTASVACNPVGDVGWKAYDVKTIILELLASYTSYNAGAMQILAIGGGSLSNYAFITTYEGDPTKAPRLEIIW